MRARRERWAGVQSWRAAWCAVWVLAALVWFAPQHHAEAAADDEIDRQILAWWPIGEEQAFAAAVFRRSPRQPEDPRLIVLRSQSRLVMALLDASGACLAAEVVRPDLWLRREGESWVDIAPSPWLASSTERRAIDVIRSGSLTGILHDPGLALPARRPLFVPVAEPGTGGLPLAFSRLERSIPLELETHDDGALRIRASGRGLCALSPEDRLPLWFELDAAASRWERVRTLQADSADPDLAKAELVLDAATSGVPSSYRARVLAVHASELLALVLPRLEVPTLATPREWSEWQLEAGQACVEVAWQIMLTHSVSASLADVERRPLLALAERWKEGRASDGDREELDAELLRISSALVPRFVDAFDAAAASCAGTTSWLDDRSTVFTLRAVVSDLLRAQIMETLRSMVLAAAGESVAPAADGREAGERDPEADSRDR